MRNDQVSTGAWAELTPAAAEPLPSVSPTCHPWGQAAGTSLRKQTGTTERGKCGGPRETFHEASTALGPTSQGLLGHGVPVGSYSKQYTSAAEIKASFS